MSLKYPELSKGVAYCIYNLMNLWKLDYISYRIDDLNILSHTMFRATISQQICLLNRPLPIAVQAVHYRRLTALLNITHSL